MYTIDDIKKGISGVPEDLLNNAISKGILKLSDDQINAVAFVFWICLLAERELDKVLKISWDLSAAGSSDDVVQRAKAILGESVSGGIDYELKLEEALDVVPNGDAEKIRQLIKDGYTRKRKINIDDTPYFTDKIKLYEAVFSKNNVSSLLWKMMNLRNDISHGRIDDLKYEGESLTLRSAREKILVDYLEATLNPDHSKSQLRDNLKLSPEQDEEVNRLFGQL